jgi:hypothetical protein
MAGTSCDRQNRCQYAGDLKWPVWPPQASHNTPRAADSTPYATHTQQWRGRSATSHTAIAALDKADPLLIATRVLREL